MHGVRPGGTGPPGDGGVALDLDAWVGRSRTRTERIGEGPALALAATLDQDPERVASAGTVPHGWHWVYFLETPRASELGADGHEARGGFLPPVQLPRRMWAGGRIRFAAPLRFGDEVRRISTIEGITSKTGRSGPLVFVTVRHRLEGAAGILVDEFQDLVYRGETHGDSAPVVHPPEGSEKIRTRSTDPVLLFRFSALTFNGHRIHYDHPYATGVEGYPNLVVHGPLLALILLEAGAERLGRPVSEFVYRARGPLFCSERFGVHLIRGEDPESDSLRLWATHAKRGIAMESEIR